MNPPTADTVPVSTLRPQRRDALPHVDRLVVGAGFFGLHGALVLARQGLRVAILDADTEPMMRASQVNQARVHNGYHYPRSLTTALSSVHYYGQFVRDFAEAVNTRFDQIYAIARSQSFMSAGRLRAVLPSSRRPVRPGRAPPVVPGRDRRVRLPDGRVQLRRRAAAPHHDRAGQPTLPG